MVKISSLLAVHMCRIECGNPLKIQFSLVYYPIYMLNQSKLNIGRHICLFIYAYDLIEVLTFAWCKKQ